MTAPTGATPGLILTALLDLAKRQGGYEAAEIGEYTSEPPNGLCFAVFINGLGSATEGGLASTDGLASFTARLYFPAFHKPKKDIDIRTANAAFGYLAQLNGNLTLGGLVRAIDVLGIEGELPRWKWGYVTIGNKVSRIADLPINTIINDAWAQAL